MIPVRKMKDVPDVCYRTKHHHDFDGYEQLGDGQIRYTCSSCHGQMVVTSRGLEGGYHVGWIEKQPARV